jgi:hypothetical protein
LTRDAQQRIVGIVGLMSIHKTCEIQKNSYLQVRSVEAFPMIEDMLNGFKYDEVKLLVFMKVLEMMLNHSADTMDA